MDRMAWLFGLLVVMAVAGFLVAAGLYFVAVCQRTRQVRRARQANVAVSRFPIDRERLEAEFLTRVQSLERPRGLKWGDIRWHDEVRFAVLEGDRRGPTAVEDGGPVVLAFVSVSVRFEAIEGGGMEDVAAVGEWRDATAVFRFVRGRWTTDGQVLFNMGPADALRRLAGECRPLNTAAESAGGLGGGPE
ncbi:MAG: hypothetical protein D6725_06390 [Planctomycetota bacterium]|nr:MAG: hypothetical protein D6725_06390 [Planctomycetota bacterium]